MVSLIHLKAHACRLLLYVILVTIKKENYTGNLIKISKWHWPNNTCWNEGLHGHQIPSEGHQEYMIEDVQANNVQSSHPSWVLTWTQHIPSQIHRDSGLVMWDLPESAKSTQWRTHPTIKHPKVLFSPISLVGNTSI